MRWLLLTTLAAALLALSAAGRSKLLEERPAKGRGLLEADFASPDEASEEEEESEEDQAKPAATKPDKDVHSWSLDDWFSGRRRLLPKLPQVEQLESRLGDIWRRIFGGGGGAKSEEVEEEKAVERREDGVKAPIESRTASGLGSAPGGGSELLGSGLDGLGWVKQVEGLFRPWWKGENVCKREELLEDEDEKADSESPASLLGSMLSTICQDSGEVYQCEVRMKKEGKSIRRRLIRECCHGWQRRSGEPGCPDPLELKSLVETLEGRNLSSLVSALDATGLRERVEEGNWTIFAPTNEALSSLGEDPIEVVLLQGEDRQDFARQILQSHLVPGWEPRHSWADEKLLTSANGDASVRLNFYGRVVTANCGRVLGKERRSDAGLVNVVDRLLMPARRTLWEMVSEDERFSSLAQLVDDELREVLAAPDSHHTLFAFTNEALEKLPGPSRQAIRDGDGCFAKLLSHLVVPHTICSAALHSRKGFLRTLSGRLLNVTLDEEKGFFVQGKKAALPDRVATNGVLHVLDDVPLLPHMQDALGAAEAAGHETFARLMREEGLDDELSGLETATLFVPPNEGLEEALPEDAEQRKDFLRNHVVDNLVEVGRKNRETLLETAAGRTLSLRVEPVSFFAAKASVGCARLSQANVEACGTRLHFLDRPLAFPSQDALQLLRGREDLSEFLTLLELSGISDEVAQAEFRGTVLAVPNEALNELLTDEKKEELVNDEEKLKSFVRRHLLKEQLCCESLGGLFGDSHESWADGVRLASRRRGDDATLGGVAVLECDQAATNGLVHVLEKPVPLPAPHRSILDLFRPRSRGHQHNSARRFDALDWPF